MEAGEILQDGNNKPGRILKQEADEEKAASSDVVNKELSSAVQPLCRKLLYIFRIWELGILRTYFEAISSVVE